MVIQRPGPLHHPMSKEVLYIGSAVPLETSAGLEAIQQPLRMRYPVNDEDIQGIPSFITVLQAGLELKYMDDPSHVVFFPYSALHQCAAVRCVSTTNTATHEVTNRFVPLAEAPHSDRPAIFTTVTRRTQGRHVLECSGFLTKNPNDAFDLVQWTSDADQKSKMNGGFVSMGGTTSAITTGNSAFEGFKGDTSFHTEANSSHEAGPINVVPGNSVSHAAKPSNYSELPKNGYFYTTENAQVKKFSLHKFARQSAPAPSQSTIAPAPVQTAPPAPVIEAAPPRISQTVEEHERSSYIMNGDHFDRRSTYSMPATRSSKLVAVRGPPPPGAPFIMGPRPMLVPRPGHPQMIHQPMVHPQMVHQSMAHQPMAHQPMAHQPMLVRPPPPGMVMAGGPIYPGMGRARPVPIMMPVPMAYPGGTLTKEKHHRRSSRSASSTSSHSSTSPSRRNRRNNQLVRRDHSFDSSSRPATPPTDYDSPPFRRHHHHASRKDEFEFRQMNGHSGGMMTMMPQRGRGGLAPGYVMLPVNGNGVYGAPTLPRAKSVPAHVEKASKKDKKSKKKSKKSSKKDKKDKDSNSKHNPLNDYYHDIDAFGYSSDSVPHQAMGASGGMNGDYAKSSKFGESRTSQLERSFAKNAAERAFSSSLAAETRKSTRGDAFNAYAINQNGVGDGEFPMMR